MDLQSLLREYQDFYRRDLQAENWEAAGDSAEVVARILEHLGRESEALPYYGLAAQHTYRSVQQDLQAGFPVTADQLDYLASAAWLYWKARKPELAEGILEELEQIQLPDLIGIGSVIATGLLLRCLLGQSERVRRAIAKQDMAQLAGDPSQLGLRLVAICLSGRKELLEETAECIRQQIRESQFELWHPNQMLFDWLEMLEQGDFGHLREIPQ